MQETYEKNFLNSKNKQEQSTGGSQEQAEQLKQMGNLIASIKMAVNEMTEKYTNMKEELTAWNNIVVATVLFFTVVKMYQKTQVILNLKTMFVKKLIVIYNLASL